MSSTNIFSLKKLVKEYENLSKDEDIPFNVGLVDESYFHWKILIIGPEDTIYEGYLLEAIINFPQTYPMSPPSMTFTTKMWHPNIFLNGSVCISILHPPEFDPTNPDERMDEKWKPVLGVKEIILSILSILSEPTTDSPANVEAAIEYRSNKDEYIKKVKNLLES